MFDGLLLTGAAVLTAILGATFYKRSSLRPLGFTLILFSFLVFMLGLFPIWAERQIGADLLGVAALLWLGSICVTKFLTIEKLQQNVIAIVIVFIFGLLIILKDEAVDIYELLTISAFLFWYAATVVQREISNRHRR